MHGSDLRAWCELGEAGEQRLLGLCVAFLCWEPGPSLGLSDIKNTQPGFF